MFSLDHARNDCRGLLGHREGLSRAAVRGGLDKVRQGKTRGCWQVIYYLKRQGRRGRQGFCGFLYIYTAFLHNKTLLVDFTKTLSTPSTLSNSGSKSTFSVPCLHPVLPCLIEKQRKTPLSRGFCEVDSTCIVQCFSYSQALVRLRVCPVRRGPLLLLSPPLL